MKNRTLLYFLDQDENGLLPADAQVINIATEEWFINLKPFFSDLIWQYYADRIVFVDQRFKRNASDTELISNIKRAFAILLKTKNYEYKKLYDTTILDYNPIWNVDGVTGTIHETTFNEATNETKSGDDTIKHTGNDNTEHRGNDALARTGNDNLEHQGYDETEFEKDTQNFATTYDSVAVDPPAEFPTEHVHEKDDKNKVSYNSNEKTNYNSTDTTTFNSNEKTTYNSDQKTEYDSAIDGSRDSFTQDLDLVIRQGNIGVTTTQKMIDEEREIALFDFYKKVVHDCVNTCTYAID